MKKKNIIKKFLSVMLSAATMFSLLALPAYAIVPGEDAYGGAQEEGYIRVDFENQTREFIPNSEIPEFTGNSTYDVLSPEERARMETINTQMASRYGNGEQISPMDVDDGDYSFVSPSNCQGMGIILLAVETAGGGWNFQTGFMIDNNNFVTTLHGIFDYDDTTDYFYISGSLPSIRAYFDVSVDLMGSNDTQTAQNILNFMTDTNNPYIMVSSGIFSSLINGEGITNTEYDWFIGKLESPVTDTTYYWDCAAISIAMEGRTAYAAGYPQEYMFRLVDANGRIRNVSNSSNLFSTTICADLGMSGGPVYIVSDEVKCYGILRSRNSVTSRMKGVKFYPDLLTYMADYMQQ